MCLRFTPRSAQRCCLHLSASNPDWRDFRMVSTYSEILLQFLQAQTQMQAAFFTGCIGLSTRESGKEKMKPMEHISTS